MQFMIAFATFVPFFNYAFDTRHTHVIDYKFVSQQKRILRSGPEYEDFFLSKRFTKTKMSYSKYSTEYHPASFSSTYFLGIH